MSVDGIRGSDPQNVRRQLLEKEREKELDSIEKKYKEQVAKTNETRQKALESIYLDQQDEIDNKSQEADQKIAKVKADADARIRAFQAESTKMTEEASRQFQQKAGQLTKTTQDLEKQRKFLINQHQDTLKNLRAEHEESEAKAHDKMQYESEKQSQLQKHRFNKMQVNSEADLRRLNEQLQTQKNRVLTEGERDLYALKERLNESAASVESQIGQERRSGETQLEHLKYSQGVASNNMKDDFENDLQDIRRRYKSSISDVMVDGKRNLETMRTEQNAQVRDAYKNNQKTLTEMQKLNDSKLYALEKDEKTKEAILKKNYDFRHKELQERKELLLNEAKQSNQNLKETVDKERSELSEALTKHRDAQLNQQTTEIQETLKNLKQVGEKQLNDRTLQYSEKLKNYTTQAADPFYRLKDLNTKVVEDATKVLVHVPVTEHEEGKVRLSMNNQTLNVNGTRRFQDKAKNPDGHNLSTNTYQSFSETFPYQGKLDMANMTRDYKNGVVTFYIPKV